MTNEEKRQADKMRRMAKKRGIKRPAKAIAAKKKNNVVSSEVKPGWMTLDAHAHLEEERDAVDRAEFYKLDREEREASAKAEEKLGKIELLPGTTPSVGRIVHYMSYGTPGGEFPKECRAAIITEVEDEQMVALAVLNPTGMFFNVSVPWASSQAPRGGTWHWPERV